MARWIATEWKTSAPHARFGCAALGLLLLCCGCGTGGRHVPAADELRTRTREMDLVVVLLDAAAARHFSFLGYERETTPHLDLIAAESVVFTSAYAQASATPLSVYSLFSSRYPLLAEEPKQGEIAAVIGPDLPVLATLLQPAYVSRLGLSANPWIGRRLGFDRGFTDFVELFSDRPGESTATHATQVVDVAQEWFHEQNQSPYFAYLHVLEPHLPYTPPEPFFSMFAPSYRGYVDGTTASLLRYRTRRPSGAAIQNTIALYDGNLRYADAEIGRLVAELERMGRWERTIFVLLSDHGEAFWEHGSRGHGLHTYEEFVRVPLLIRIPGEPALRGLRVERPVELVDLLPTLLDLADLPFAVGEFDGQSLLPLILGGDSTELEDEAVAYMRNHEAGQLELSLRRGDLKLIHYLGRRSDGLYDLRADPQERHNLLRRHPSEAKLDAQARGDGLLEEIRHWLNSGNDVDQRTPPQTATVDSLDAATLERLRALGYVR